MKKGVIIELRDKYAYVLSHNGKIKKIKREYYHEVGQDIQIPFITMKRVVPVVAVACSLIIGIVINSFRQGAIQEVQAMSYLSLSVNPGIVLKVDANDQIVAVSYTNQEGKEITSEIDFINKSLEDSVIIFIDYCFENGYFENNNQIDINVISDDEERITKIESQVQTLIENYLKDHQVTITIQIDEVTTSQQESAESLGIPDTKVKLIDLILYYYPELDKETLAKMKVDDLIDYLEDVGYDEDLLDRLEDEIEENEKHAEEASEESSESSSSKKKISGEEAKKIALNEVDGRVDDVDYEDDENVFEICIKTSSGKKYEVIIDAGTGNVLKVEED